jgi:putative glutamate/gamma-aminobutyrate antiporter
MTSKKALTVWMIGLINVAAISNIKNFPLLAQYGWSVIFFLILSSIFFFIPVSLVSAELASGWPERGVYTWVRHALGPRMGFLAIWLQWIENVIWYPTVLIFIASTFAYLFNPELANNKTYTLCMVIGTFWPATFLNFFGMRVSGWFSSLSAMLGTIAPIALIIVLGFWWMCSGQPIQIPFSKQALFPDLASMTQLGLFAGILLGLAGMEMSSVHAKDVENPQRNYPKAILLSAILILLFSGFGAIAIAAIVPNAGLASGGMEAFKILFDALQIPWATPLLAGIMTFGALGMMSTWIVGPSRGLYATAEQGDIPPLFQKTNKHNMPVNILLTQAIIVTIMTFLIHFMPSVNSSYYVFVALASILYMVMYVLMFISAIVLHKRASHIKRAYHVPGGKFGLWFVSILGIIGSSAGFILGFLPPSDTTNVSEYITLLILGTIFFCALPLFIFHHRKPHWKK